MRILFFFLNEHITFVKKNSGDCQLYLSPKGNNVSKVAAYLTLCNIKSGPMIRVRNGIFFFLFLNQNICCGYSKEPSQ